MTSSILILHPGALGDIILAAPVLRALRESHQAARLELAGRRDILAFFSPFYADRFYSLDDPRFLPLFKTAPAAEELSPFADYELAISLFPDREGIVAGNLRRAGVKEIVAFSFRPLGEEPVSDYLLHLLAPWLGEVTVDPDEPLLTASLHKPAGTKPMEETIFAVHPGSGSPEKCWPWENFREVLRHFAAHCSLRPLILLGPAELEAGHFQTSDLPSDTMLMVDRPITEVAAVLQQASLYLGNDGGITHLAAALGVPSLALFGPTSSITWRPRGPKVRILSAGMACSPCRTFSRTWCAQSPPQRCLKEISPAGVISALEEILSV